MTVALNVHGFLQKEHLPLVERVEFEGARWYRFPGETDPANYFASVTNVLSVANPKPLVDYFKRTSYRKQTEELEHAANLGTFIHELVDRDLQGIEIVEKDLQFKTDTETLNLTDWFKRWQKLKEEKQITAEALEVPVVNTRLGYAGTLDFIGTYQDQPAIFDVKSGFYSVKAGYQLTAYKIAFESMTIKPDFIFGSDGEDGIIEFCQGCGIADYNLKETEHYHSGIKLVGLSLPWNKEMKTFLYEHETFCWNRFLDALGLFRGLYYRKLEKMGWKYLQVERDGKP